MCSTGAGTHGPMHEGWRWRRGWKRGLASQSACQALICCGLEGVTQGGRRAYASPLVMYSHRCRGIRCLRAQEASGRLPCPALPCPASSSALALPYGTE